MKLDIGTTMDSLSLSLSMDSRISADGHSGSS